MFRGILFWCDYHNPHSLSREMEKGDVRAELPIVRQKRSWVVGFGEKPAASACVPHFDSCRFGGNELARAVRALTSCLGRRTRCATHRVFRTIVSIDARPPGVGNV